MANTTSSIQTINGIPVCDMAARSNIENMQNQIDGLASLNNHIHSEYITREEAVTIFATEEYTNNKMLELKESLGLDQYVTKQELYERNYMTAAEADGLYITKDELDKEVEDFKANYLKNYALLADFNAVKSRVESMEAKLDNLKKQQDEMLIEIENLKNK